MEFYNNAVNMFIRPPRAQYAPTDLGPVRFNVGPLTFMREDISILNKRGLQLQCSHFQPIKEQRLHRALPCVVYLHGNCGCRLDALETLYLLLTQNVTLFCFDFAGSGLSGGDYISLGFHEKEDVLSVVEYLKGQELVSRIGLWGMSMGAATALMFAALHPTAVSCLILDSPFAKLTRVAQDIVNAHESKAPKWLVSGAANLGLKFVRKSIKKKAKFDIRANDPLSMVDKCQAPAFFGHGDADRVIPQQHSIELHAKYPVSAKRFFGFQGDHNTPRPAQFYHLVSRFLFDHLFSDNDRQLLGGPRPLMGNTPKTQSASCWLVRRLPADAREASTLVMMDCLCLLRVDKHGYHLFTPYAETLISSLRWYVVAIYWSVPNHFCVDWRTADESGRWVFFAMEADAIMAETKRIIDNLKPRSKKKLMVRAPVAQGLDKVPPGVKAFSPKLQLTEGAAAEHPAESPAPAAVAGPADGGPAVPEEPRHSRKHESLKLKEPALDPHPWEAYAAQPDAPAPPAPDEQKAAPVAEPEISVASSPRAIPPEVANFAARLRTSQQMSSGTAAAAPAASAAPAAPPADPPAEQRPHKRRSRKHKLKRDLDASKAGVVPAKASEAHDQPSAQ